MINEVEGEKGGREGEGRRRRERCPRRKKKGRLQENFSSLLLRHFCRVVVCTPYNGLFASLSLSFLVLYHTLSTLRSLISPPEGGEAGGDDVGGYLRKKTKTKKKGLLLLLCVVSGRVYRNMA